MKNLYMFISVIEVLTVVPIFASDLLSQPILKQFEVNKNNVVIKEFDRVNQRSEIIADGISYLRLECHADYPVQWIYTGNGLPILNSDISIEPSTTERRNEDQFVASVFLGPLKEHHTGKYSCSRTDYVTVTPNLYLYVPGQNLFSSTEGKIIKINPQANAVTIPCTVSHPNVDVELIKIVKGTATKPVKKSDDAIVYGDRNGFRINLRQVEDPEGIYLCTGSYNGLVKDVEYTVTSKSIGPAPAKYEEYKQHPEETCDGKSCIRCETHTDCPSELSCFVGNVCRDPCTNSQTGCGYASSCRVVANNVQCYCPPGFVGNPKKECINVSRQRYQQYP